jgi:intergrase/recombinase
MDLDDCLEALRDGETLSNSEFRKCKQMFKNFIEFLYDEGVIDEEFEEINERLKDFFESIDVEGDE